MIEKADSGRENWPLALLLGIVGCLVVAASIKGGSLDEYWTIAFADPRTPLRAAFLDWSADKGHPVGFYALNRLLAPIFPAEIFWRRLANLLYFLPLIAISLGSNRRDRVFELLFIAVMAASPYFIERFAENRATFLALVLVATMVLLARRRILAPGLQPSTTLYLALLSAMLAVTDYPVALAGGGLLGAWLIDSLFRRDPGAAVAPFTGLAILGGIGLVSMLNSSRVDLPSPYYQPFSGLILDTAAVVATVFLPVAALLAIAAFRQARAGMAPRRAIAWLADNRFAWAMVVALALTSVAFLLVNAATHALIRRQLFGLIPLEAALLVELSLWRMRASDIALVASCILLVAVGSAAALIRKPSFERYAFDMHSAQQACPSLMIYAVHPDRLTPSSHLFNRFPSTADPFFTGYEKVADAYDFQLQPTAIGMPLPVDPSCGVLVWIEGAYIVGSPTPEWIARRAGLDADPATLSRATVRYAGHSLLMIVPPPSLRALPHIR